LFFLFSKGVLDKKAAWESTESKGKSRKTNLVMRMAANGREKIFRLCLGKDGNQFSEGWASRSLAIMRGPSYFHNPLVGQGPGKGVQRGWGRVGLEDSGRGGWGGRRGPHWEKKKRAILLKENWPGRMITKTDTTRSAASQGRQQTTGASEPGGGKWEKGKKQAW